MEYISGMKDWINVRKSISVIQNIFRLKKKKCIIISVQKECGKI